MKKENEINATVCLYGASHCGFGYLAETREGACDFRTNERHIFGDGEPKAGRMMNAAVADALSELRHAGVHGMVRVFAAGGELCADYTLKGPCPRADEVEWKAAPVLVISSEEIARAAEAK